MNSAELRKLLKRSGCTFETHKGGSGHVTVRLGDRKTQIPMHGGRKESGTGLVRSLAREERSIMDYPIATTRDDDGTLLVTCPDLPEVTTFGDDEADALVHGRDAVEEALAARMDAFAVIPRPGTGTLKVRVRLPMAMKLELYWALAASGMTRADMVRALGWHRTQVDRLFDPNHATRLDQFDAAFEAMKLQADVRLKVA